MLRDNGSLAPCASCRHQRKKCTEDCVLAPYLTLQKNQEFQAVHKVFGVSNVAKIVKSIDVEDRERAVDSLVWEATCRQNDPVLGSYGEFIRVSQELDKYKSLYWNNFHAQGNMSMNMNKNVSVALLPADSYPGYGYQTFKPAGTLRDEIGYHDYPHAQGMEGLKEESNKNALVFPLQYSLQNTENLKGGSNEGSVILPQPYSTPGMIQPYNGQLPGEFGPSTDTSSGAQP